MSAGSNDRSGDLCLRNENDCILNQNGFNPVGPLGIPICMINPYLEHADELGPNHGIEGIGYLGPWLEPSGYTLGDTPISPSKALALYDESREIARLKLDGEAKGKTPTTNSFHSEDAVHSDLKTNCKLEWHQRLKLDQLVLRERIVIHSSYIKLQSSTKALAFGLGPDKTIESSVYYKVNQAPTIVPVCSDPVHGYLGNSELDKTPRNSLEHEKAQPRPMSRSTVGDRLAFQDDGDEESPRLLKKPRFERKGKKEKTKPWYTDYLAQLSPLPTSEPSQEALQAGRDYRERVAAEKAALPRITPKKRKQSLKVTNNSPSLAIRNEKTARVLVANGAADSSGLFPDLITDAAKAEYLESLRYETKKQYVSPQQIFPGAFYSGTATSQPHETELAQRSLDNNAELCE